MGINNEGMINRRLLLVKAGSFMKISWRKSREFIIDKSEDDGEDSNNLRQCGKRKKRNLSVRFSDILHEVPSNNNGPMSNDEIENRWYQVRYECVCSRNRLQQQLDISFYSRFSISIQLYLLCIDFNIRNTIQTEWRLFSF
jgi:hypothetical protein